MCNKYNRSCNCKIKPTENTPTFKVGDKVDIYFRASVYKCLQGVVAAVIPELTAPIIVNVDGIIWKFDARGICGDYCICIHKEKKSITKYMNVYKSGTLYCHSTKEMATRKAVHDCVGIAIPFTYEWEE